MFRTRIWLSQNLRIPLGWFRVPLRSIRTDSSYLSAGIFPVAGRFQMLHKMSSYISDSLSLYGFDSCVVTHLRDPVFRWFALLCLWSASLVCSRWFVCDSCFCTWPTPIAFSFATFVRPVFYWVLFHFILSRILWQFRMNWQRLSLRESVLEYQGITPAGLTRTYRSLKFVLRVSRSRRLLAILKAHLCARYIGFAFLSYWRFTLHLTSYWTEYRRFKSLTAVGSALSKSSAHYPF